MRTTHQMCAPRRYLKIGFESANIDRFGKILSTKVSENDHLNLTTLARFRVAEHPPSYGSAMPLHNKGQFQAYRPTQNAEAFVRDAWSPEMLDSIASSSHVLSPCCSDYDIACSAQSLRKDDPQILIFFTV